MTKISLFEKFIEANAKKYVKEFPKSLREYAKKTIEHLLEAGRDMAIVDSYVRTTESFYFDSSLYRERFETNSDTISSYCKYVSQIEMPFNALKVLEETDNIPLIRFRGLKKSIEESNPKNIEELKKFFDLLKEKNKEILDRYARKAEDLENFLSNKKYNQGFYKRTPYDSQSNYDARD